MSERTRFLGLDAHMASIAVAVADEDGSVEEYGTVVNEASAVRRLVQRLAAPNVRLKAAYEAGPTGYALHRQLTALGVECIVVAPSLTPVRPGDRIKTDRRDSIKLARLLRSGDLTAVWVPDQEHEALRNLVRARADAKADALRAKHRLSKFLLRQGARPPVGVRAWSAKWEAWLNTVHFDHPADDIVFDDYRAVVRAADDRVRRLDTALMQCADSTAHGHVVAALQALRGIGFLTAVTIVAEAGDLRRFASARQFMSYVGLVPTEYSSGTSRHRGRITKAGNAHLRHVLGEASHHARFVPALNSSLKRRHAGLGNDVVALSWRAQQRLHLRYRHLSGRLGRPKALTAVARELAGFVWAVGQLVEVPAA